MLEPLHGYIKLAEELLAEQTQFASSFNFGPVVEVPVGNESRPILQTCGDGASWKRDADPGAHEAHYLRLDSSKACAQLGWRPRLKIELALEWTVSWYRALHDGGNMPMETRDQIAEYERPPG